MNDFKISYLKELPKKEIRRRKGSIIRYLTEFSNTDELIMQIDTQGRYVSSHAAYTGWKRAISREGYPYHVIESVDQNKIYIVKPDYEDCAQEKSKEDGSLTPNSQILPFLR